MKLLTLTTAMLPMMTKGATLHKRAGGPIPRPIPAKCTIINPLPHAHCGTANISGYQPSQAFLNASLLYPSYFVNAVSPAAEAEFCRQQCYDYGNPGQCKGSFVAFNATVPKGYYGSPGGELATTCLLFSSNPDPNDFVPAPEGEFVNATAANIYCPS